MSKIGLLIFPLLAALLTKCRSQQCPCNDAALFPGTINGYGIARGLKKSLSTVSVSFWINAPASYQETHNPTMLSYSTSGDNDLVVWIESGSLVVTRGLISTVMSAEFRIADGTLHHVCVTWDPSTGHVKFYVDGMKSQEVKEKKLETGRIPAGGTWIIGQDQDKFEGGFEKINAMKGVLAEVNVWDRILCSYEIKALASSCGPLMKGNVKAQKDFEIIGSVETFKPVCCQGN